MTELPKPWKWVEYGTIGPHGHLFRAEDDKGRRIDRWTGPWLGQKRDEPIEADDVRNVALVDQLQADNARLRALIKAAEWSTQDYSICPWCSREEREGAHMLDCRAFTPEGAVR